MFRKEMIFMISSFFIYCYLLANKPLLADEFSPAQKIQNKFRNISINLCLDLLKAAASNEEGKEWLEKIEGETLEQKAKKLTSELMKRWKKAFFVSDSEAERLLSGNYADEKNRKIIKNCISEFADRKVPLPLIFRYLISKFHRGEINSGLLLEFTARLFKEHLKQITKLNKE